MTIMVDEDEDSDCLYIDEREEPESPKRQKTDQNSTETTAPVSNKKISGLRNVRIKSAELPPVNYLPLMKNDTLNTIKNNILNASEKPRITIKDFARVDTNSIETNNSALYALLTGNATSSLADFGTALPVDEALRSEAQIKDPRVAEIWVPTSNAYKAIPTAPDHRETAEHTIHSYMDTPRDQSVPRILPNAYGEMPRIPPNANAYEVSNGNILPHTQSAHKMNARQASVIVPNLGNLSGGTMTYPPSNQTHNGHTKNYPTANNLSCCPVQNGQTHYMEAYNRPHTTAPPEYNHATANYHRAKQPMNCPPGYPCCTLAMNMPTHPLNLQPHHPRKPPPPYMYAMGMTCNGQRLASANPHVMPNPHNVPWNCYGQYSTNSISVNTPCGHAYGSNSIPLNAPHRGQDTAAYLAEMHSQAYLQKQSLKRPEWIRMEAIRTETTHVVSSAHTNQKQGVKTTKKRNYTKISTNKTQVVMNNSEIPASNNAIGNNSVNIPNGDTFGNKKTTTKKRATRNTKNSKVKTSIPANNQVALSNIEIQPARNNIENIEISNIDLTSECTQTSMNYFPNVIQPPMNTEPRLPPTIMKTNAADNITTVSHYIDIADDKQAPINKEANLKPKPMEMNNYDAPTEQMKTQKGAINININRGPPVINTELEIINHNGNEAQIPLILDQHADNNNKLNKNKAQIEMTIQKITNEKLQNGVFMQPPNNNTALTLLDKNNDRAQTDVTAIPKPLFQSSSNTYGVNVTTSTTTEKISHNIERNEVLRSNTVNTATGSIQDVETASSILNTVDYQTETRVTTVEVFNHITNISVQTLRDILDKVQVHSKPATIVDQADDHKPQENENKHDDKLETARKKLARLREIEHKNEYSSCKQVENIAQKDTECPFKIKIATGPNGEYIAQVISVSNDGSIVTDENIQLNCSTGNTEQISTSNNENNSHSIENNQEINAASEISESIRNEMCDEANGSIDEDLFFKFQINFFRLVQERLSENNFQELADELCKDIYDLIAKSDDNGAKADMKYKCHVCRNITIYSPRSLYYKVTNHLEYSFDKAQNCPRCITFRKKYVDIFIKYMAIEAPTDRTYSGTNKNAVQRDVARANSSDVRQSYSENSLQNQEDSKDINQEENCDIENQLSLITNGVPSSPEKAKLDDQERPNAEHVLDVSKTTQDGKTNEFVVKLPRNLLKESTIKALMQNKSDREKAILNIATNDISNQAKKSGIREPSCFSINAEIVTSTIAELHNRNLNNSTNNNDKERGLEVGKIIDVAINRMYRNSTNNNNEANPRHIMKRIGAQDATGTKIEEPNRNTNSASNRKEDNDINQKTPCIIWRTISAETAASTYIEPQTNNTNKSLNNNKATVENREKHPKQSTSVDAKTATGINLEPNPKNANVTANDDSHTDKRQEKRRKIANNIVESATIINSGHDKNQEKHLKKKSISAETSAISKNAVSSPNRCDDNIINKEGNREEQNVTYEERRNVTTNTSNDKHNDNNSVRNRELSESIDKETSSISITITNSNTTNTQFNKGESGKAPKATAAIAEKDDVSRSDEKHENNKKTRNNVENDDANDGRKASGKKHDQGGDEDIQMVEKALDDRLKTLKENSNLNDDLPQVKISGKKRKKKGTKSKEHESFEDISYEYRCRVCNVRFKYERFCLNHMNKNHNIQNPVVPLNCINMECKFCDQYVPTIPKLYNAHIKIAHSDKFFKKL